MSTVDWIAVGAVALGAIAGLRRGLVASALSLVALVGGAVVGARAAPHLLSGGAGSPWTPVAGLVGALVGGALLRTAAGIVGSVVRGSLRLTPLGMLDSLGGLLAGAAAALAVVWVAGAAALFLPGQTSLRDAALHSLVLRRLNEAVSPRELLHVLARLDPLPSLQGPAAPSGPLDPTVVDDPNVRRAAASVVRIQGSACGLGVEGSGWVARRGLVVTAAHVVAGQADTTVELAGGRPRRAQVVAFDVRNDIAVLRVAGLPAAPLPLVDARPGAAVTIAGYPANGPRHLTPGRIGSTAFTLTQDARGNGPVARAVTSIAGRIRHGNSGGPAIDRSGAVETTVFAARQGADSGYGVPTAAVRRALDGARKPVDTGACAG